MKFDIGQRKAYLAALILLVVAIALVCVWQLWFKDDDDAGEPQPAPTVAASVSPWGEFRTAVPTAAPGATDIAETGADVDTVVYYQDNYGYLVPVMCSVPLEDGIAKATLSMMVSSAQNDMQAARLGLRTVIPQNVSIDLDINDGKARIDLSKEAMEHEEAASEANMVSAIVQTLTEFDTVSSVDFLFDGQKVSTLPHGTDVSRTMSRGDINLETTAVSTSAGSAMKKLTLYFPGESASVVVPVTRMVYSDPDIDTAVLELTKGPASDALEDAIPDGCGLIDVTVENGVARLNFTAEFMQIVNNIDGGRLALKALVATCTQFEGVESVEILVEGEKWDPGDEPLAAPSFANIADDIGYNYIQTQSSAIFEGE
jgi:germination protein M